MSPTLLLILGFAAGLLVDIKKFFPNIASNPVFKAIDSVVEALAALTTGGTPPAPPAA